MNYWVEQSDAQAVIEAPYFRYHDPALALTPWRTIKLLRGLARHPSPQIRKAACHELVSFHGWGQDECGASLTAQHREQTQARLPEWNKADLETRRLMTTINNGKLRAQYCSLWQKEHANDTDNGCPADQPPPATIVTASGDVPLPGPWPQ